MFKIHSEGWVYFIIFIIITIICFPFSKILCLFFLILTLYIYYFFRDPERSIPADEFIVSPADGIITYVGEENSPIINNKNEKYKKISIFLNIFNVHVNRIPSSGEITKIKYIHGKFLNATMDKSSEDNERNIIQLKQDNGEIIYITQIAGLIARRIVCEIKENQNVFKGDRFGIIKFGSRVDLYLPLNYKILVAKGQIVVGGETIISNPNNIVELSKSIKN